MCVCVYVCEVDSGQWTPYLTLSRGENEPRIWKLQKRGLNQVRDNYERQPEENVEMRHDGNQVLVIGCDGWVRTQR